MGPQEDFTLALHLANLCKKTGDTRPAVIGWPIWAKAEQMVLVELSKGHETPNRYPITLRNWIRAHFIEAMFGPEQYVGALPPFQAHVRSYASTSLQSLTPVRPESFEHPWRVYLLYIEPTHDRTVYALRALLRSFNPTINIIGSDGDGMNPTAS